MNLVFNSGWHIFILIDNISTKGTKASYKIHLFSFSLRKQAFAHLKFSEIFMKPQN